MDRSLLEPLVARHGIGPLVARTVLVVDDEQPNLDVVEAMLDGEYTVLTSGDGAAALEIARERSIDVVVADQRMPGLTGVELLESLRAFRPDVAGIILSGYSDAPVLVSAINRARVFRYLRKPVGMDELRAVVGEALDAVYTDRAVRMLLEVLARRTDELGRTVDELRMTQSQLLHLERLSVLGRLASGLAHDLANALASLFMVEQWVQRRLGSDDFANTLSVSLSSMRNIETTLQTLKGYARGDTMDLHPQPIEPGRVVEDAIAVMKLDEDFRERTVGVNVTPGLPIVRADLPKLVQVLVNLLRNALHATGPGQYIAVECSRFGSDSILYAVEDHGPGVPESLRPTLFQAFRSTKGERGMGLGLYMARLIVEAHEGRIGYLTPAGGGARFEIIIPSRRH